MRDVIPSGNTVFLQIQNSKKPQQVISLVLDESNGHFETEGLRTHFGLEEIWINQGDFLQWMEEYAQVISFLLETMSEAQDLNLPYGYQDRFAFRGQNYSLFKENEFRVLRRQK